MAETAVLSVDEGFETWVSKGISQHETAGPTMLNEDHRKFPKP